MIFIMDQSAGNFTQYSNAMILISDYCSHQRSHSELSNKLTPVRKFILRLLYLFYLHRPTFSGAGQHHLWIHEVQELSEEYSYPVKHITCHKREAFFNNRLYNLHISQTGH
jgi:hypothetical protein